MNSLRTNSRGRPPHGRLLRHSCSPSFPGRGPTRAARRRLRARRLRRRPRRPRTPPRRRTRPSRGWTSTAPRCSTWATRRSRTTRTGSTWCGRRSCRPTRTSTARTATSSPASGRAASAFKGFMPTSLGELKTIFEFELFGTGVDAGQTTFRLRHAWGELGQIGAGQTWSPFMDPDVFPNSIEYWGPNGMVFFRNVQFRWTPWQKGDSNFMIALERPGASADQGDLRRPHRARGRQGPLPAAGPLGALPQGGRLGPRPGGRHPAADQVGRPERRPVRPQRQRHRLGLQPQLEPEDREARGAALGRLRRGHPELHERRAGGRRHREQPPEPGDAGRGQGAADPRASWRSSTSTGTRSGRARSATRSWTSTTATGRPPTRTRRASTRSRTSSTTRPRTSSWAPRSSGASARTSGTASRRTTSASSSRSSTTSSYQLGGK